MEGDGGRFDWLRNFKKKSSLFFLGLLILREELGDLRALYEGGGLLGGLKHLYHRRGKCFCRAIFCVFLKTWLY